LPIAAGAGFFAFPWKGEQPTEIWALARLRYMLKPRVRIWNQDGVKDLVTVLAPKKIEQRRSYKDSLTQKEVESRLKALADTIDSRGWATRNAAYSAAGQQQWARPTTTATVPGSMPVTSNISSDDMFDPASSVAQGLDAMLSESSNQQRQRVMQQMNQPQPAQPSVPQPNPYANAPQLPAPVMPTQPMTNPQQGNWFANGPAYPTAPQQAAPQYQQPAAVSPAPMPQSAYIESDAPMAIAATPTPEETQLGENIRQQNQAMAVNYEHMRVLQPAASNVPQSTDNYSGTASDTAQTSAAAYGTSSADEPVTRTPDPAILELANNDDLDIATIARQANKQIKQSPDEVEIRLH